MNSLYEQFVSKSRNIADLQYAAAVLEWDKEVCMPAASADIRSQQIATLSETAHHWLVDPSFETLILQLSEDHLLSELQKDNVKLSLKDLQKLKKKSPAFVRKMSETISKSYHKWIEARKANDFSVYMPALKELVELKKEEAELYGYEKHPYDALLKDYEESASVEMLDKVFADLLPGLKSIIKVHASKSNDQFTFLHNFYEIDQQLEWGKFLAKEMGLPENKSRLDISEHPFTTNFSATDVRITTRIDPKDVSSNTWSCIHEAGHALYELGLPIDQYGLPRGTFASLSIHESQSRFWENCVGRSKAFWTYYLPKMKEFFPIQLNNISLDTFYEAINVIQPSLVRTEADEVTYHMHIIIRYEIEKGLIGGTIKVENLKEEWNRLYKEYLGVDVPDDKQGCLQDIHWSLGSFGYFPTYSLGSMYAAQFWEELKKQHPNIEDEITDGNLSSTLDWLRSNIHQYGKKYTSEEFAEKITREPLNSKVFLKYISDKMNQVKEK